MKKIIRKVVLWAFDSRICIRRKTLIELVKDSYSQIPISTDLDQLELHSLECMYDILGHEIDRRIVAKIDGKDIINTVDRTVVSR